jgi:4-pyridoxate dehydrogenase
MIEPWLESARQAGWPLTSDMNGPDNIGVGRVQYTIRDGRRASASNAYLRPAIRRPNLTVRTGAIVTGVTMRGTRATGVRLLEQSRLVDFQADREVILSAGVFGSPQILMLSGIGPTNDLRRHDISSLLDLPVGQNLRDHLAVLMCWSRRAPGPFQQLLRLDRVALAMAQAAIMRAGPAVSLPLELIGFVKTRAGLDAPNIEFIMTGARMQDARPWLPFVQTPSQDLMGIRAVLLHSKSEGKVSLRSADPSEPVRIAFNFLSERSDLIELRDACRLGFGVAIRKPLDPFRGALIEPKTGIDSDADLEAWIRATAITVNHPCGTCAMGLGENSVLNPDLTVRGTERLRVVDASAFPDMLSAHINAAVMAVAERASDLIRRRKPLQPVH